MTSSKPSSANHKSYFVFSAKYLVLTGVTYGALVVSPLALVKHRWLEAVMMLVLALVCFKFIHDILTEYFTSAYKAQRFADLMTIVTIFPPVIGPVIVLVYSLGETS